MKTILTRLALLSLIIPVAANCYAGDQRNIPRLKTGTCCTCEEGNSEQPTDGAPQAQMNLGGWVDDLLGDIRLTTHTEKPSPVFFSPGGISVGGSNGLPMLLNVRENANGSTSIESQETCEQISATIEPGQDADTVPLSCDGTLTGIEVTERTAFNFVPMTGGLSFLMAVQQISAGGNKVVFLKKPDGRSARYSMAGEMISYTAANGHTTVLADLPVEQRTEIIRPNGELRQVKTPNGLADVQVLPGDSQGYVINYYEAAQVGAKGSTGLYTFTGAPAKILRVENPEWQEKKYAKVTITTTTGSVSRTNSYSYNDANREWTQILPDGTKIVKRDTVPQNTVPAGRASAINHFERTKERYAADGTLIGRTKYVIWLTKDEVERVLFEIKDEGGLNGTTAYDYYTDAGNAKTYAQLKSKQNFDGSWEYYTYDAQGRIAKQYSPWLDTPFSANIPANETGYRVSEYSYTPVASGDVVLKNDQRARVLVERINGIETGRTYFAYPKTGSGETQEVEERACQQGAPFGYTGNLRVTTTYFADSAGESSAGKEKTVQQENGRLTTYSYALNPHSADAYLVTTRTEGTVANPGGVPGKTWQIKTTSDSRGRMNKEEFFAYIGGMYAPVSVLENHYDLDGNIIEKRRNGNVVYNATYVDNQLIRSTDEAGITIAYTYDVMGNVATSTRQPIGSQSARTTTYTRTLGGIDCGCDGSLQATITAGGLSLTTRTVKDKLGRLVEQVDEAGLTTTFAYTQGGRVTTILKPNTATEIRETYLDGTPKGFTGTGIVLQYYTYGINADGTQWTKLTQVDPNGPRWTRQMTDLLDRKIRVENPGYGGAVIAVAHTYDVQGRLAQAIQTVIGGTAPTFSGNSLASTTSYAYNDLGNVITITVTQGGNSSVSEADTFYNMDNGIVWEERWSKKDGIVIHRQRNRMSLSGDLAAESHTLGAPESNSPVFSWAAAATATRYTLNVQRASSTQIGTTKLPTSIQPQIETTIGGLLASSIASTHGGATLYRYDALGRQTGIKYPRHQNYSSTIYNACGQASEVTDAAGNKTTYAYYGNGVAGAGQLRQQTDPTGGTVYHQYDLQDRKIHTWGSAVYPVAQGYNAYGQRNLLRTYRDTNADFSGGIFPGNASGDTTTWTYDAATGALLRKTYEDGNGPSYDYYADGPVRTRTWARKDSLGNSLTTTYAYNPQGKLTKIDYSDETPDVVYTYNSRGQRTAVTDGAGTRTFDYDSGSLKVTMESFTGVVTGTLHRTYDVYNRPVGIALPDADYQVTYGYDNNGRLDKVGENYTYAYLENSDLVSVVTGRDHTVENAYENNRDILLAKTNRLKSGDILSRYTYTANGLGLRSTRTQSGSAFSQASTDTFGYNSRAEVVKSANSLNAAMEWSFDYDYIGNRTSTSEGRGFFSKTYVSNNLNQYHNITANDVTHNPTYDLDGNLLVDGDGKTYTWDCENRLIQVNLANGSIVRYTYDSNSRCVRRISIGGGITKPSTSLYDGWNVILKEDGTISEGIIRTINIWGLELNNTMQGNGGVGGLLMSAFPNSSSMDYSYTYDGNGNVSELIGANGYLRAHYEYDPFGQESVSTGGDAQSNEYRFSTKSWDRSAKLYYYGYRFYQPQDGRWINRDPIEERGGRHLYSFVNNNSANLVDLLGLKFVGPEPDDEPRPGRFDKPCKDCDKLLEEVKKSTEGRNLIDQLEEKKNKNQCLYRMECLPCLTPGTPPAYATVLPWPINTTPKTTRIPFTSIVVCCDAAKKDCPSGKNSKLKTKHKNFVAMAVIHELGHALDRCDTGITESCAASVCTEINAYYHAGCDGYTDERERRQCVEAMAKGSAKASGFCRGKTDSEIEKLIKDNYDDCKTKGSSVM